MRTMLVTGGAGFIGSNFVDRVFRDRPDTRIVVLDALTYAGNLDNFAPELRDHPRFEFVYGNINNLTLVDRLVATGGPGRALRGREPRRAFDRRRARVLRDRRDGDAVGRERLRRAPEDARAPRPHLDQRGLRLGRARADGRGPSAAPLEPVRRGEGRRGSPRGQLRPHLRPAGGDHPALQQLRPAPAPREVRAALRDLGAARGAARTPRRRDRGAGLGLRRGLRRGRPRRARRAALTGQGTRDQPRDQPGDVGRRHRDAGALALGARGPRTPVGRRPSRAGAISTSAMRASPGSSSAGARRSGSPRASRGPSPGIGITVPGGTACAGCGTSG